MSLNIWKVFYIIFIINISSNVIVLIDTFHP